MIFGLGKTGSGGCEVFGGQEFDAGGVKEFGGRETLVNKSSTLN